MIGCTLRRCAVATTLLASTLLTSLPAAADGTVNVYSYRQPVLIEPLFKAFTDKTGIKVRYIFAKKGLVERLAQEGRASPQQAPRQELNWCRRRPVPVEFQGSRQEMC